MIDAAKAKGVKAFVLQTSLLTNAAAVGQADNPNYKFLNLLGGVLDRKLVRLACTDLQAKTYVPGGAAFAARFRISALDCTYILDAMPVVLPNRGVVGAVKIIVCEEVLASIAGGMFVSAMQQEAYCLVAASPTVGGLKDRVVVTTMAGSGCAEDALVQTGWLETPTASVCQLFPLHYHAHNIMPLPTTAVLLLLIVLQLLAVA